MASRRRIRSTLSRVALAAILLAVQVTVAGHLDFDGHSQETQCAICVSESTLDAANVSDYELVIGVAHTESPTAELPALVSARSGSHHLARGPPLAS
jgi:hypothetical protein